MSSGAAWPAAGAAIAVWRVDLVHGAAALLAFERETPRLAADEGPRAAALGGGDPDHPRARQRRATYVALRIILEGVFGTGVRGVPLRRSALGRPSLAGIEGDFSLSHVADHALVAVVRRGRVGIDLERTRAERMSPRRQALIVQAAIEIGGPIGAEGARDRDAPADACGQVLAAWVRLEAYAKARQIGMARLLTAIGVLGGGEPATGPGLATAFSSLADIGEGGDAPGTAQSGAPGMSQSSAIEIRDLALPHGLYAACAWTGHGTAPPAPLPRAPTLLPRDLAGLRVLAD